MPPKASRVTSTVRAPRSAARNAATTPAGPAPMTSTSIIYAHLRGPCSGIQVRQPAQRSQPRHEAVLPAARDNEPRQALETLTDRPAGNAHVSRQVVGPADGVRLGVRPDELAVVDPR